jgi:hypothetical protein
MQSKNSSESNQPASQPTKQPISATSRMLTPSELASLRQSAKEGHDYFQKAFEKKSTA